MEIDTEKVTNTHWKGFSAMLGEEYILIVPFINQ